MAERKVFTITMEAVYEVEIDVEEEEDGREVIADMIDDDPDSVINEKTIVSDRLKIKEGAYVPAKGEVIWN